MCYSNLFSSMNMGSSHGGYVMSTRSGHNRSLSNLMMCVTTSYSSGCDTGPELEKVGNLGSINPDHIFSVHLNVCEPFYVTKGFPDLFKWKIFVKHKVRIF